MARPFWNRLISGSLALAAVLPLAACQQAKPSLSIGEALVINEVVTSNRQSYQDPVLGSPDWVELKNVSQQEIHLGGLYLSDDEQDAKKASPLPEVTLAPGELLLLLANDTQQEGCLGFHLKKSGETLYLLDTHMQTLSSLTVPELIGDVSYARRDDGTYGYCELPTPKAENGSIAAERPAISYLDKLSNDTAFDGTGKLPIVCEVVTGNEESLIAEGCPAHSDWVELYNPGNEPIELSRFCLGDSQKAYIPLPDRDLQPGERLILCCGEGACTAPGHVRLDLGLSSQGEELILTDSRQEPLFTLTIPALPKDVSYAMDSQGVWTYCLLPTPGMAPVDGDMTASLEPQPDDGTQPLVINEVLIDNRYSIMDQDGDRPDFVELYNQGTAPVDTKGYYLSDSVEDLEKWALPSLTVEPGAYVLVFLSGKDRSQGEWHASFSIKAGETMTLYNSRTRRYDSLLLLKAPPNISQGRDGDGKAVFFGMPTPKSANGHPLPTE